MVVDGDDYEIHIEVTKGRVLVSSEWTNEPISTKQARALAAALLAAADAADAAQEMAAHG